MAGGSILVDWKVYGCQILARSAQDMEKVRFALRDRRG